MELLGEDVEGEEAEEEEEEENRGHQRQDQKAGDLGLISQPKIEGLGSSSEKLAGGLIKGNQDSQGRPKTTQLLGARQGHRRRGLGERESLEASIFLATLGILLSVIAGFILMQGLRYHQRPLHYELRHRRTRARTGDIVVCSVRFRSMANLVNGGIPKLFMATPANHAGLFYTPGGREQSPIYVLHRTFKGNRLESVLKFSKVYDSMLMVKVEPPPPEDLIMSIAETKGDSRISGLSLVSLFFNSHLRDLMGSTAPVLMKDQAHSCIRLVMEILQEAGICRVKVPLDSIVPKDVLQFSNPDNPIVEALPPYSFSPPIVMGPFGGEAAFFPGDYPIDS